MGLRGFVSATRRNTLLWMQAAQVKERGRGAGSGALSCGDCGSLGSGEGIQGFDSVQGFDSSVPAIGDEPQSIHGENLRDL
ncbi:hypothetical protein U1Q18_014988 [Sarracenia purpurea var. burkii]